MRTYLTHLPTYPPPTHTTYPPAHLPTYPPSHLPTYVSTLTPQQLVEEANQRWLAEEDGVVDDITAVVVRLQHGQPAQQPSAEVPG